MPSVLSHRALLSRGPALRRIACLVLAAVALSGCIVVPAYPYHPWGPRYSYYR